MEAEDDLMVDKWAFYYDDPNDQHICMEVVQGRAHCSLMLYDNPYADAILNKLFLSLDCNLGSMMFSFGRWWDGTMNIFK